MSSGFTNWVIFLWWSSSGHPDHNYADVVSLSFQRFSIFDVSSVDFLKGGVIVHVGVIFSGCSCGGRLRVILVTIS